MSNFFSKAVRLLRCKYLNIRLSVLRREISFFEDYISKTIADPDSNSVRKLVAREMQDSWLPSSREEQRVVEYEMKALGCK